MDDLQYAGSTMDQTLRELEIINRWLGGNAVTLDALGQIIETAGGNHKYIGQSQNGNKPLEIADLGCGRGDMLRHINEWATRRNLNVQLTGVDANPYIIAAARANLGDLPVTLKSINIHSEEFDSLRYDIVIGTLFFHHFSDDELVIFFAKLRNVCRLGFIINDIHRHPVAYHSIRLLTKMFSRSDMVKYDAPLSVLRAFTRNELETILRRAGFTDYQLKWRWAFRWQICVYC